MLSKGQKQALEECVTATLMHLDVMKVLRQLPAIAEESEQVFQGLSITHAKLEAVLKEG